MLVEGDDAAPGLNVETLGQGAQPAGVLGGDEVGLLQGAAQALGGIGDVTDRGGGQGDSSSAQMRAVGGERGTGGFGIVLGGRDAVSHRTQYVGATSMTPPPRLGV